jgi:parallel beta-helix repeat protein
MAATRSIVERSRAMLLLFAFAAPAAGEGLKTVRDFGAVGDGRADDTAAIQQAVASRIGDVRFPRGVYRISRPIVVDLDRAGPVSLAGEGTARIVIAGPGPAFKFVGTHEGTADPPTFKPNVWERQRSPMVDGLEIVGGHAEACGIEAAGTMQLTVTRTLIRKVLHAIHLVRRNRNMVVSDCHLYENRGAGIFYDNVSLHQSNVTGCHISYNGAGGIVCRGGDVRNIQVAGCDLEANMDTGGPPAANVLIDCSGGAAGIAEIAVTGCTIQHSNVPGAANIRYVGADAQDRRWGHFTITGNVLSDVQWNIDLKKARGVTIVGNTFWMGFAGDLRAEDCSNLVIGANAFDRNPAYAYGNSLEAKGGVTLRDCRDCSLTGLHLNGVHGAEAGLVLRNCRRCLVANCTVLDCQNAGVLLDNVSDSRLSGCLIRNDSPGGKAWTPLTVLGGRNNILEKEPMP